ncbi:hypothetical protein [Leptothrix ochracea]|uniref:hypothetical protein n=1 Tax=Leptothrix ochracea TaxID=735331 RepID=UPI0034E1EC20
MNTSSSTHRRNHRRNHRHLGRHLPRYALPWVLMLGLGGCAQFIGHPDQAVPIRSSPENATVVIRDGQGQRVFKGTTPTIVSLPKSNGSYFGGQSYDVEISLPGYISRRVRLRADVSLGAIFGNVFLAPIGLVGLLLVDPWNGNMYNLNPSAVSVNLPVPPQPDPADADDEPILVKP